MRLRRWRGEHPAAIRPHRQPGTLRVRRVRAVHRADLPVPTTFLRRAAALGRRLQPARRLHRRQGPAAQPLSARCRRGVRARGGVQRLRRHRDRAAGLRARTLRGGHRGLCRRDRRRRGPDPGPARRRHDGGLCAVLRTGAAERGRAAEMGARGLLRRTPQPSGDLAETGRRGLLVRWELWRKLRRKLQWQLLGGHLRADPGVRGLPVHPDPAGDARAQAQQRRPSTDLCRERCRGRAAAGGGEGLPGAVAGGADQDPQRPEPRTAGGLRP